MSDSKLQRWALMAEIIGGIAIVVSLVFVGYEIRGSTKEAELNRRAVEVSAYQQLIQSIFDLNDDVVHDPSFADSYRRSWNGETLEPTEQMRLSEWFMNHFRHGDMAYFQFQNGIIDQERLRSSVNVIVVRISEITIAKLLWEERKHFFSKEYTDYLDKLLLERTSEYFKQAENN